VDNDIDWVEARLDSPRGLIESAWRKDGKTIVLEITIPANSSATVHVPTNKVESVLLNGKALDSSHKGYSGVLGNRVICRLGSGKYQFVADWK
jgi:alpha-L-rhamnosidase